MAKTFDIFCRYYQVREVINGEITTNLYDLRSWINAISKRDMADKCRTVNKVFGRLENQLRIGTTEIYPLNFMRMDSVSTYYKAQVNNLAEHIDIDVAGDEYIAKNTVCLYDSENSIMMIQCNKGGYSEKSIENYINDFFDERVCCLLPIFENINFIGENVKYMKLDIRLANLREFEATDNTGFEQIVDGMNRVNGTNAHIEISLGYDKEKRLNSDEVRVAITDLTNNRGCVTSAKIKLSDDQISGTFDLFDNLSKDIVKCAIDAKGGIPFEKLAESMSKKYIFEDARGRIQRILSN